MGSLEVRLANELLRLPVATFYIQVKHALNACLFFQRIKTPFQLPMDASIFIIQLWQVWKAVVWESPEIQFCKWPFPPSGAQTIKWGEIAKWFLCAQICATIYSLLGHLFKFNDGWTPFKSSLGKIYIWSWWRINSDGGVLRELMTMMLMVMGMVMMRMMVMCLGTTWVGWWPLSRDQNSAAGNLSTNCILHTTFSTIL